MGMELRYGAGNRSSRVASAYHRAGGLINEIVRDQKAGSSGRAGEFNGTPVGDEREILIAGVFEGRHPADLAVPFALPGRFQQDGQFFDAQAFGLLSFKGYSI